MSASLEFPGAEGVAIGDELYCRRTTAPGRVCEEIGELVGVLLIDVRVTVLGALGLEMDVHNGEISSFVEAIRPDVDSTSLRAWRVLVCKVDINEAPRGDRRTIDPTGLLVWSIFAGVEEVSAWRWERR